MGIFASPTDIKLNKNFFIRDAVFLLADLALLLYAVYMKGVIDMRISVSMIAMYGVYAVVVIIQDKLFSAQHAADDIG